MAYIDHVQCGSCGHGFQPEDIDASDQSAKCPKCGAALSMIDFFGVSDAFSDPDQADLSLDDLVGGKGARPKWEDPEVDPVGDFGHGHERWRSSGAPADATPPARGDESPDEAEPKSVMDVLRAMKRKG